MKPILYMKSSWDSWGLFIPYGSFIEDDSYDDDYINTLVDEATLQRLKEVVPLKEVEQLPEGDIFVMEINRRLSALNIMCDYGTKVVRILFPETEKMTPDEFHKWLEGGLLHDQRTKEFFLTYHPNAFRKMVFALAQYELVKRGFYVNKKRQIENYCQGITPFLRHPVDKPITDDIVESFEKFLEEKKCPHALKVFRKWKATPKYTHISVKITDGDDYLQDLYCPTGYFDWGSHCEIDGDVAVFVPEISRLYVGVNSSNVGYTAEFEVAKAEYECGKLVSLTVKGEDGREFEVRVEELKRSKSYEIPELGYCNTI